ncbi:sugar ABC transporter ATP-binding protein [Clostridium tetani]|uniref:Ribose import ATP-binding protein RbsA n=1 Tax=Clostridium tetani (strain Massachusetts / E88) TaxID=212717 RepID=RBSA_CLOTE|nr:sugar ABC transporter ATP-binding protein [Clostridium tetani]Q891M1.1 RecName: Full=Ribose import ATP-binding protein RbsA [Clostridium tetani E88]AAO36824.1 ribose transport ATP-binding protein rbsA [Clostridium tetani E88]KGI39168.1 D-ribose transporter ATP-binding protein [Clostridium tetani ATCC 9441]KGI41211.1 D-ribose transporter ATP-binding protein [Clostridium tetani]KGI45959.1 D-ribose transporter ATP-binding protein [Clostridium tetani]KHO31169.1 D-ribose transporter ATP-binding
MKKENLEEKPFLQMKGISKFFSGVQALDNVELKVYRGEVLALLGENGAGKSTLMKILSGVYTKDEGDIFIDEKKVDIKGIKEAEELGISIIHQELSLLSNLKIYENIFLGSEKYKGIFNKLDKDYMRSESEKLLSTIGFTADVDILAKDINIGEMQMIEIIKAISKKSKLIIMDEPTTALTEVETERLFKVINKLKSEGICIIYISHRLDEIFQICDRVNVLRDGKYVGEVKVKDTTKDDLITMMVGRKLEEQFPYKKVKKGDALLAVNNLSYKNKVKNISFEVRAGEILGLAGLMGSGRTELAKTIFGEYKKSSGDIYINDKKINITSPKEAIENGIAYLSEDRKKEGLILNMSVGNNISLCNLKKYENSIKKINKEKESKEIDDYIKKLSVKTPSANQIIKNLSGGNQQKAIIAKWIMISPNILIIDEPTRGIDVGAKKEIYEVLNEIKSLGKAIIMISSDMPEVLGISDRILVMSEGNLSGELSREEATQEKIMKYAVAFSN